MKTFSILVLSVSLLFAGVKIAEGNPCGNLDRVETLNLRLGPKENPLEIDVHLMDETTFYRAIDGSDAAMVLSTMPRATDYLGNGPALATDKKMLLVSLNSIKEAGNLLRVIGEALTGVYDDVAPLELYEGTSYWNIANQSIRGVILTPTLVRRAFPWLNSPDHDAHRVVHLAIVIRDAEQSSAIKGLLSQ